VHPETLLTTYLEISRKLNVVNTVRSERHLLGVLRVGEYLVLILHNFQDKSAYFRTIKDRCHGLSLPAVLSLLEGATAHDVGGCLGFRVRVIHCTCLVS